MSKLKAMVGKRLTSGSAPPASGWGSAGADAVGVRVPTPVSTASLPRGVMKANGRETVDVAAATFMTGLSELVRVEH
ncbi:hypothetical protein E6C67_19770 [Azospirillum sp. TSA2s]|nr:hypothetical protein E6C67_19770 [Azospirillum sp. TSA2s]